MGNDMNLSEAVSSVRFTSEEVTSEHPWLSRIGLSEALQCALVAISSLSAEEILAMDQDLIAIIQTLAGPLRGQLVERLISAVADLTSEDAITFCLSAWNLIDEACVTARVRCLMVCRPLLERVLLRGLASTCCSNTAVHGVNGAAPTLSCAVGGSTHTTNHDGGSTHTTNQDGGSTHTTNHDGGSTHTTNHHGGSTHTTNHDGGSTHSGSTNTNKSDNNSTHTREYDDGSAASACGGSLRALLDASPRLKFRAHRILRAVFEQSGRHPTVAHACAQLLPAAAGGRLQAAAKALQLGRPSCAVQLLEQLFRRRSWRSAASDVRWMMALYPRQMLGLVNCDALQRSPHLRRFILPVWDGAESEDDATDMLHSR